MSRTWHRYEISCKTV
ncbi:hypothetical protein F383_17327 [Gossypium arboreum]|uniref:Uncharacterized protein n=1 Tax=Gossypium arboreum TaxID=29729 RepID=A0A0B0NNE0_GOSAR|nr:hypothetical protein F383_17327 [Gossypium arboreum]